MIFQKVPASGVPTGTPKGIVRDIGGHIVALKWTMKNIYNIDVDDIWWSASDIGWIVGHSYICLLYTSPSPRDRTRSRMPSSA